MSPQNSSVSTSKPLVNNNTEFKGSLDSVEPSNSSHKPARQPTAASNLHDDATAHLQHSNEDEITEKTEKDNSFSYDVVESGATDQPHFDVHDDLGSKLKSSADHVNTSSCEVSKVDGVEISDKKEHLCTDTSVLAEVAVRLSAAVNENEQMRRSRTASDECVAQSLTPDCSKSCIVLAVPKSESNSASLESVPMDVRLTNQLNLQNASSSIQASNTEHNDNISAENYNRKDNADFYSEAEAESGTYWRSMSFSSPSNSISYDSSQKEVSEASRLENTVGIELLMSAERLSLQNGSSKESIASGVKLPYDQSHVDSVQCDMLGSLTDDVDEDQSQFYLQQESLRNYLVAQGGSIGLENCAPSSNSRASAQPLDSHSSDVLQNNSTRPLSEQIQQPDQLFSRNSDENAVPRVAPSAGECAPDAIAEEISSRVRKRSRRRRSSSLLGSCWLNRRSVFASTWRRFLRWCGSSERRPNEPATEARQNPAVRTLSRSVCKSGPPLGTAEASGVGAVSSAGKPDPSTNRACPAMCAERVNPPLDSPALSMKSFKGAMQAAASIAGKGAKISPVDESKHASTINIGATSSGQCVSNSTSRKNSNNSSLKHLPKVCRSSSSKMTSMKSSSTEENLNNSNSSKGSKSEIASVVKAAAEKLNRSQAKKSVKNQPLPDEDVHDSELEAAGEDPAGDVPSGDSMPLVVGSSRGDHMRKVRSRRLMKEFQELTKISQSTTNPVFSVALVNDCLYEWKVKLHRIDQDSFLHRDMIACGVPFILFSMTFPDNFPFHPPFLRVLSPRVEKGFVMEGGAICMELLTPRGWASAYTIEAIIMQLAASLVKGHARISRKPLKDFNQKAAEASFRSLVRTHEKYGWVTPPLADG
ncbi:Ubiquitin-conjugating enzyme E2 [Trinorchestia longiramus]|nr:Ubiquitin-conjugating enzyme E2 [Trinorchestia longiramus]